MKRLRHFDRIHEPDAPKPPRRHRSFKALAGVLLVSSLIGCAPAIRPGQFQGTLPSEFYSQYLDSSLEVYGSDRVRRVSVNGHAVSVMLPVQGIRLLDTDSQTYRLPPLTENGDYAMRAMIQNVVFRREPVPESNGQIRIISGSVVMGYAIYSDGSNHGFVAFPESLDSETSRPQPQPESSPGAATSVPGLRDIPAEDFAALFRSVAGQDLINVKLLVVNHLMHTDPNITVHVVGASRDGQILGRWQNGYVAFGMTFYPGRNQVRSGLGLLMDSQDLSRLPPP